MEEGDSHSFQAHLAQSILRNGGSGGDSVSRATSPGLGFSTQHESSSSSTAEQQQIERTKRYRPRTYPYFKLLPYNVEEEAERNNALEEILKQLYVAIKAEDIAPGAVHWTRELRGWLNLKFEITRELRVRLVKLYYMLCLAPGIDSAAADRFESMFRTLTK
jgi:proteasome activator subunit 4